MLSQAIRDVHKGKRVLQSRHRQAAPSQNPRMLDRRDAPWRSRAHLSSRELEVLQLIAEGQANKQIAAELGISIKTVEKHRHHIMRKLDIHDTAGLTRYAIAAGIIEKQCPGDHPIDSSGVRLSHVGSCNSPLRFSEWGRFLCWRVELRETASHPRTSPGPT